MPSLFHMMLQAAVALQHSQACKLRSKNNQLVDAGLGNTDGSSSGLLANDQSGGAAWQVLVSRRLVNGVL